MIKVDAAAAVTGASAGTVAAGVTGAAGSISAEERTRIARQFEGLFLRELWHAMSDSLEAENSSGSSLGGALGAGLGTGLGPYGALMDGAMSDWLSGTPMGNLGSGIEEALTRFLAQDTTHDAENALARLAAGADAAQASDSVSGMVYRPLGSEAQDGAEGANGAALAGGAFEAIAKRVDAQSDSIGVAARASGLDANLIRAVVHQESAGDPDARSSKGALGLMQLMPDTARAEGISEPLNPRENLVGGARYLRDLLERFGGDMGKALAAYNAGPAAVERANGIPPYAETRAYVPRVLGLVEKYRERGAQPPASSVPAQGPMESAGEEP